MLVKNAELKNGVLKMNCTGVCNYQVVANLVEKLEIETTDTIFENDEISIKTTNKKNVYYVTNPSRDYEFVGIYKDFN